MEDRARSGVTMLLLRPAEVDAGRVVEAEVDAERIAAVGEGEELAAVDGAEAPTLAAAGEGEADAEQRGRPG
jgi:hypothetical protein